MCLRFDVKKARGDPTLIAGDGPLDDGSWRHTMSSFAGLTSLAYGVSERPPVQMWHREVRSLRLESEIRNIIPLFSV